jgi:hypothetical protein
LFLARFLQDSDIGAVLWPVCGLFRVNQIIEGNISAAMKINKTLSTSKRGIFSSWAQGYQAARCLLR